MQTLPAHETKPNHVRVRVARRCQRFRRRCAEAGDTAVGCEIESESDSAQRRAGHSVRAPVGRGDRSFREGSGRSRPARVGQEEPRTRHPGGVRTVDCRRTAEIARSAAGSRPSLNRSVILSVKESMKLLCALLVGVLMFAPVRSQAQEKVEFEVASVRPFSIAPQANDASITLGVRMDGAQVRIGGLTMRDLLATAYRGRLNELSAPE